MSESRGRLLSGFARVYAGLGAALAILALLDAGGLATGHLLSDRVKWQTHTYDVLSDVEDVSVGLRAVESAHRGYVATGDARFLAEYDSARTGLLGAVAGVRELTTDNAAQQKRTARLDTLLVRRLAHIDSANVLRSAGDVTGAAASIMAGKSSEVRQQISDLLRDVRASEKTMLVRRNARVTNSLGLMHWLTVAGIITSILLVILSTWLLRVETRRRRKAKRELLASEERLRDFLDTASDLIQSSAPDGRMLYVNNALLRTLGYTADEVIGQSSDMLFAPEELEHGRVLFARLLAGEVVTDIETVYLRKDGRRVHVSGSSSCRFEGGLPTATRTILHDVTRQREVDHMKDEFVSIVSHELRTPLTSIRGALGLLANGMLGDIPDRGKRMLDVAINNTDRLVRLINDILDVERIESGAVPMVRKRVSLAVILTQVDELMRPYADREGVKLEIGSLDVDIDADADRIVQTLTNLVSNAAKFSASGTMVRVDAAREIENVHIRVRDEGRGIPADMLETVFERFQQVDASDNRDKGGSGLGLSISRGIVEQHDGRIWAESTLNEGATFHVLLPIMASARAYSDPRATAASDAPLVLICDDDDDVRTVIGEMLTHRGYRIITAADGAAAIEMAAVQRPAVILLDLLMPGEYDGWRTISALKERTETRDIPVIIVSGSAEASLRRPVQQAHHEEAHMRKPVEPDALVRSIEHALTQWGAGANVLVVEDDEDLARVLLEFLRTHGLRPVHACSGREAVQLSQKIEPSLIILDLMLPDTDGFAVVDWLRQHDRLRDVPIMVYTARDLDEEQRTRLDIAPELLFTKSRMPPEQLVDRVAAMVGRMTWDHDQAK